jgi:hypothetical protein
VIWDVFIFRIERWGVRGRVGSWSALLEEALLLLFFATFLGRGTGL